MPDDKTKKAPLKRILSAFALSRDFSILMVALAVVSLGFGLLGPLMPVFRSRIGVSESELGWAFSLYSFVFVFALPPSGLLADRIGRKPTIMAGTVLFGLTTLALVFVTDFTQFTILRALEGVGTALVTPAAFALTIDIVPEDKRGIAMGAEGTAQLLGALAGPALGGFVAGTVDFTYPFYIAAGLAVACAAVIYLIKEPKIHAPANGKGSLLTMFSAWRNNAKEKPALYALTTRGFVMGIVQGLWGLGLLLYWADEVGMTLTETGIAMSLGAVTMALATIPFGALSDKYGRRPFILAGGSLMAGGLGMMVMATETWHVYALTIVSEFGAAMSNPSVGAMLADVMSKKERGRVMGAYQTVQGVGNIIGFSALGQMYEKVSPQAPVLTCTGALAVATGIIAGFVGETHTTPSSPKAPIIDAASSSANPSSCDSAEKS